MAKEKFKRFKGGEAFSSITDGWLNGIGRAVERLDNTAAGSGRYGVSNGAFDSYRDEPPTRIRWVRLAEPIGPEDSSEFRNRRGIVQAWDATADEFKDTDPADEITVICDPYGLPADEDAIIPVIWHYSGRYLPLWSRTTRIARTCKDDGDEYPPEVDGDGKTPNTYPIQFVRVEYTEAAGHQEREIEKLNPDDEGLNGFVNNLGELYIPEGRLIFVFNLTGQWFTSVGDSADGDDSSSSSESLEDSSSSKSSSSSSSGDGCKIGDTKFEDITGFNKNERQVLGHDPYGCLKWYNVSDCP